MALAKALRVVGCLVRPVLPGRVRPRVTPQVMELRFGRRRMGLRYAPRPKRPTRLGDDLQPAPGHIISDRRVRHITPAVLAHQPGQHPPGRMPAKSELAHGIFGDPVDGHSLD